MAFTSEAGPYRLDIDDDGRAVSMLSDHGVDRYDVAPHLLAGYFLRLTHRLGHANDQPIVTHRGRPWLAPWGAGIESGNAHQLELPDGSPPLVDWRAQPPDLWLPDVHGNGGLELFRLPGDGRRYLVALAGPEISGHHWCLELGIVSDQAHLREGETAVTDLDRLADAVATPTPAEDTPFPTVSGGTAVATAIDVWLVFQTRDDGPPGCIATTRSPFRLPMHPMLRYDPDDWTARLAGIR